MLACEQNLENLSFLFDSTIQYRIQKYQRVKTHSGGQRYFLLKRFAMLMGAILHEQEHFMRHLLSNHALDALNSLLRPSHPHFLEPSRIDCNDVNVNQARITY